MKTLAVLLILAVSAAAQSAPTFPDAPSHLRSQWEKKPPNPYLAPFRDPSFYLGVGVFSASAIYDVHSTKVCEANKTCVEAYKGHDRYTYVLPLMGFVAAGTYGCDLMLYQHKWWRRAICPGIGIGMSIIHWKDGSTIYKNDLVARQ